MDVVRIWQRKLPEETDVSTKPFLPQAFLPDLEEEDEDEGSGAAARRTCVGCHHLSPPTRSEHTLISAQHGWRLSRVPVAGGEARLEWRCPSCWAKHRHRRLGLL